MLQDISNGTHSSADRMEAFLKEMAGLVGQDDDNPDAVPVLELQLGDVRTLTMLLSDNKVPALSITVFLPRHELLAYSQQALSDGALGKDDVTNTVWLWHADEGCYAMIRNIPLQQLSDERSIFDAILDTADQAEQWHAFLCARLARPH